jgi:hypothetical protein
MKLIRSESIGGGRSHERETTLPMHLDSAGKIFGRGDWSREHEQQGSDPDQKSKPKEGETTAHTRCTNRFFY